MNWIIIKHEHWSINDIWNEIKKTKNSYTAFIFAGINSSAFSSNTFYSSAEVLVSTNFFRLLFNAFFLFYSYWSNRFTLWMSVLCSNSNSAIIIILKLHIILIGILCTCRKRNSLFLFIAIFSLRVSSSIFICLFFLLVHSISSVVDKIVFPLDSVCVNIFDTRELCCGIQKSKRI